MLYVPVILTACQNWDCEILLTLNFLFLIHFLLHCAAFHFVSHFLLVFPFILLLNFPLPAWSTICFSKQIIAGCRPPLSWPIPENYAFYMWFPVSMGWQWKSLWLLLILALPFMLLPCVQLHPLCPIWLRPLLFTLYRPRLPILTHPLDQLKETCKAVVGLLNTSPSGGIRFKSVLFFIWFLFHSRKVIHFKEFWIYSDCLIFSFHCTYSTANKTGKTFWIRVLKLF